MRSSVSYFTSSFVVTVVGLALGAWLGWREGGLTPALSMAFLCAVLAVLEVSLSFDNAVVNAKILRDMTPVWRHRFLTWGMVIAVFGMRLVFPLVIVAVVASLGPIEALKLAATQPERYAHLIQSVHTEIAAFGGAFLLMVGLSYFFDESKDTHWIGPLEKLMARLGRLQGIGLGVTMIVLYVISTLLAEEHVKGFLVAGLWGLVTFIAVDGVSALLHVPEATMKDAHRASAASFMYLEVLDASFSFDGVVGAFAVTNNLFIIAIGLGIGAMFVRSLTILLVEKGTLAHFLYLEHGAFYAIGALATMMFLGTFVHVSEVITGLIGAAIICVALVASVRHTRRQTKVAVLEATHPSPSGPTKER